MKCPKCNAIIKGVNQNRSVTPVRRIDNGKQVTRYKPGKVVNSIKPCGCTVDNDLFYALVEKLRKEWENEKRKPQQS